MPPKTKPPHLSPWPTWGGIALMATAALWSASASSLSAYGFITVGTEQSSYFWCLVVLVAGAFLYIIDEKGLTMRGLFRVGVCLGFLFVILVFWFRLGTNVFAYWKLKTISPAQWAEMSADLEALITEATPEDARTGFYVTREDVPKSLHPLGFREPGGGFAYSRDTETMVYVWYGNKSRSWGLSVGTEWHKFRQWTQVSSNAFFFIGSYD